MELRYETLEAEAKAWRKRADSVWKVLGGHECEPARRAFESSLRHFAEQRLCIAVMGEIKTGKSTLLNAFIGEELLQTDQLECTAVPTWVRWTDDEDFDDNRQAVVTYADGKSDAMPWSQVSAYTTVDQDTWKKIERVEITLSQPADGERRPTGLVLVDTPGLNGNPQLEPRSIHQLGMSHVTIVVVPVDKIGRKTDSDLIKEALKIADRVMVVINKCDQQAKTGDGFEKFKEELRGRIPELSYKNIYTLSAKRGLDDAAYRDGEDELKEEMYRFALDLRNALADPVSALRRRPVALLREICKGELARIKKIDAESDADVSKDVEEARKRLEEARRNLEYSQEEVLRLARKTMVNEMDGIQRFLDEMRPVVRLEMEKFIDGLGDTLLDQDDLEAAQKKVSEQLGKRMQEPIFNRMSRLLKALARRLIFDLESRGVSRVRLDLPEVAPLRLNTAALEQQADTASQALRRYQDEIEGLKQAVEKWEGKVKRREARIATLSRQCEPLEGLEKQRKKAVSDRKKLGPKPNPKVEFYTATETKKVWRGGLGFWDWVLGPIEKKVKVKRQRRDYSNVEQWESRHKAANKNISGLDKEIKPLKKKCAERQKIKDELPKLQRETGKARKKLKQAEERLDKKQDEYREASRETRRAQLREGMRRELENIFDALPQAFGREADDMLEGISEEFSHRFKKAADQQAKSLAEEMERRQKLAQAEDAGRAKRAASRQVLERTLVALPQ